MLFVLEDIGGREYQEDRHSVKINLYKDFDYVAIFDGHGGYQVAEFLKFHLKDYIKKHLALGKSPVVALKEAFIDAHKALPIQISYMTGSAVVVILRRKNEIWVANAGDSRAIKITSNSYTPLSEDHKPNRPSELSRIQNLGGIVTFNQNDVPRVQGNLALSRSIGDKYLEPYVICIPEVKHFLITKESKYIIMATDGLWDVLTNLQVTQITNNILKRKKPLKALGRDCINELLKEARKRGSTDNTSILFWVL
jgi:serine/threonine protein phosphatase PrpC